MKCLLVALALASASSLLAAPAFRLSGSTTVKGALEAKRMELEAQLGSPIELNATGSNAGLASLAAGQADLAMIASPLAEVAQKLNDKTPGSIDPAAYHAAQIGAVRIVFIVNPHNPVRKLTASQLAGVLGGKVQNWQEVGGPDLPVVVVTLANAGSLVQEKLMQSGPMTPRARQLPNATQIPPVVSQEPGAIGIISEAHARGKTSLIETDAEIMAPLFLVTKGEPGPEQRKLIEAARKLLDPAS